MNAEVQAFIDKWAEKSAAKAEVLVALGAAKQFDWKAENALTDKEAKQHSAAASEQWGIVESRGIHGDEGRLYEEALALAEAYVESHPEQFISFEDYVHPDNHDLLVQLIATMSKAGRPEEAAKLTMFELTRFERKNITQAIKVGIRKTRNGS